MRIPHLGNLKEAMRLGIAAVLLDLHEGRRTEARTQLLALHRILGRYNSELSLVSQLTRQSSGIIRATWDAIGHAGWTEHELKLMQETLASVDYIGPMIASSRME